MPITFNGNGTVTGLAVGGLPDGTVDADTLASGVGGKVLQIQQQQKQMFFHKLVLLLIQVLYLTTLFQ